MIFSYNWLKDYLKGKVPEPKKLAEVLTLHSFEVESVEKKGKDWVLDIDVLSNRAHDCFSHIGVAREVSVLTTNKFQRAAGGWRPNFKFQEDKKIKAKDVIKVEVKDKKDCPRYAAKVILGVKVASSPKWLQERLEVCGLQSINNIVDIANYVMLETGQPIHAFDLDKVNFIFNPKNLIEKLKLTKNYDLVFWLSDGSVPLLFGKNNILHFQVPFRNVNGKSLLNKIKLSRINNIVCNSSFTKEVIDKEFGINSRVIFPPIDVDSFSPAKKENSIIYVGRFSQLLQAKRQDILIKVFKKMIDSGLKNWKLILTGAVDIGGDDYYQELLKMAKNYPIQVIKNPDFQTVKKLYAQSKIFWSASGYGIDEQKEPQKVEHFGMTIVEAMVSGCIPLVVEKGGAKEIIIDQENGFFWETEDQLIEVTKKILDDEKLLEKIQGKVIESGRRFSVENFTNKFNEII